MGRADSRRRKPRARHNQSRYRNKSVRAMRRRQARVTEKWQRHGWEFVSQRERRFRPELKIRKAKPTRRFNQGLTIGRYSPAEASASLLLSSFRTIR